jgi:hypothetical protein
MAELRLAFEQAFANVQRHAGIGSEPVPVDMVVREIAALRDLRGLRFEFLETHHVRRFALHPLA